MSLFKFIKSKDFLFTILKALATGVAIIGLTWLCLRFYTKHGEQVMVPNLKDLSLNEAVQKLGNQKLSYKLIDSTYVKGKAGIIYDQIPSDSSYVKSGREIYLKVYRTVPPQKPVRFRVGDPYEIVKAKILRKGFEVETKRQPGEFDNVILGAYAGDKELRDGDLVGMGEKIKLIVSEQKSKKIDLPNFRGLTLSEVKTELSNAVLNLDIPLFDESVLTSLDSLNATVYKQFPKYESGKKVNQGSLINVWLRIEPEIEIDSDDEIIDESNPFEET